MSLYYSFQIIILVHCSFPQCMRNNCKAKTVTVRIQRHVVFYSYNLLFKLYIVPHARNQCPQHSCPSRIVSLIQWLFYLYDFAFSNSLKFLYYFKTRRNISMFSYLGKCEHYYNIENHSIFSRFGNLCNFFLLWRFKYCPAKSSKFSAHHLDF